MADIINKGWKRTGTGYAAAINAQGASYTAPSDGYLCGTFAGNGDRAGTVSINNLEVANTYLSSGESVILFVRKGDVCVSRSGVGTYSLKFYPMGGVNHLYTFCVNALHHLKGGVQHERQGRKKDSKENIYECACNRRDDNDLTTRGYGAGFGFARRSIGRLVLLACRIFRCAENKCGILRKWHIACTSRREQRFYDNVHIITKAGCPA